MLFKEANETLLRGGARRSERSIYHTSWRARNVETVMMMAKVFDLPNKLKPFVFRGCHVKHVLEPVIHVMYQRKRGISH